MRKLVKIALAVACVALVGVTAWQTSGPREREPVYRGRKLSTWLSGYVTSTYSVEEGNEAVLAAGTNAFPTLLRLVRASDSGFKRKLMALVQHQHVIKMDYLPASKWNAAASSAFWLLGTNAQAAVPALIEIVEQNVSPDSQRSATYSLAGIGPAARQAVPSLLRWTTSGNPMVQNTAKFSLFAIDPEAAAKAGITNRWRFSRHESDERVSESINKAKAGITNHP